MEAFQPPKQTPKKTKTTSRITTKKDSMENRRGTQLQSSLSGGTSQPTQTHTNCSPASLPTHATTYPFGSAIHIPIYQPLYKYSTNSAERGFSRSYKLISTTAIPNFSSISSQTKTFPQGIPGKKKRN
jgi:hypothetical protein